MNILKTLIKILISAVLLLAFGVSMLYLYTFARYGREKDEKSLDIAHNNEKKPAEGAELSFLSWNISHGARYSGCENRQGSDALCESAVRDNISGIISVLSGLKPDFVLLQDVDIDSTATFNVDQSFLFMKSLECYSSSVALNFDTAYLPTPVLNPAGKRVSGLKTMSGYGMETSVRLALPTSSGLSKFNNYDYCFSLSKIKVTESAYLCVFNFRLSENASLAEKQLGEILEKMKAEQAAGNYVVAGGDFQNRISPDGEDISNAEKLIGSLDIKALSGDFELAGPGSEEKTATYYDFADGNFYVTDGFIVSSNIEITFSEVIGGNFEYSDHNPVLIKAKLK